MALIWKTAEAPVTGPVQSGFSWPVWYAKNKQRLSEKRAKRYKEDAAYRESVLERSRHQRELSKQPVYTGPYTVSFNDAALQLNTTVWVLREWRRKNYFPEPRRREGRLWFTPEQVKLLDRLRGFFLQHGVRTSEGSRPELENVISLVYSNWN